MSEHITKKDKAKDVWVMYCPACLEDGMKIKEEEGYVPKYASRRYTFKHLRAHLRSDRHSRKQLIDVAMTSALYIVEGGAKRVDEVIGI